MGFTTPIFFFMFFPACILGVFICGLAERFFRKLRLRDLCLTAASLAFYGWACFDGILWLAVYILSVWLLGCLTARLRGSPLTLPVFEAQEDGSVRIRSGLRVSAALFALTAAGILWLLLRYKYAAFAVSSWNALTGGALSVQTAAAPLGLSFLTFSALSYLADIRRGAAEPGSLLDCALYLSFFPKVISGPIVLWRDFQPQISGRSVSAEDAAEGINRIMIGFAKKLLLADTFSACIHDMEAAAAGAGIDAVTAWGAVLLYMLQIYYDFSGYSDIAIGLGRLLGFHFAENFHFPYLSRSITEFWRRWHISLGSWFREYVYIPLGGSRRGLRRTLVNLAVVFVLTGLWHGASWTYVLWGAVNGAAVLWERTVRDRRWYRRIPEWLKWLGASFLTMLLWELFRFPTLHDAGQWAKIMLGLTSYPRLFFTHAYFFDFRMVCLTLTGILGATVLGLKPIRERWEKLRRRPFFFAVQELVLLALLAVAVMAMVNNDYSPFIYFQY